MENIAASVKQLVSDFYNRHLKLTEEITSLKMDETKWTLKEIIGHLVDSAVNNHQRITRLLLNSELHFPPYETEQWIVIEKWNMLGWPEILNLFKYYNLFLSHLISNVSPGCLQNRWIKVDRVVTLEELITDYLRHFKEHLNHFETRLKEIEED